MAFAYVGDRGTAQAKDSATTLSLSPTTGMPAGALVVVWFTTDSVHNAGSPETDLNRRMRVTDSNGNTYVTLVAQTGGGTQTFCMASLFICRLRTALSTSDTITAEFHTNGGTAAKAMSVSEFSMSADPLKTWAFRTKANVVSSAIDPPAISFTGLESNTEYLLLHLLAGEGPNTDTYTWDADYTQITGDGTTGGADDTNQHVRGGWRIATLTADTVNVTSLTADRDYTQLYAAVIETPLDGAFPNWPVLDDFNRANENPLDNGTWNTTITTTDVFKGQLLSNEAAPGSNNGGSVWNTTLTGADGEAYMTLAEIHSPSATAVHLHSSGSAAGGTFNSWGLEYAVGQTNAVGPYIVLGSGANGASSAQIDQPSLRIWTDIADGGKIGLQRRAPVSHVWVDYGQGVGWEWVAATYEIATLNSGKPGFGIRGSTNRIDDFGAGVEPGWIPQIYRRTSS